MKQYTAVFLDLDNTLLDFNRSEQTAVRRVLALHGLPDDVETAKIYSGINQQYWEAYERGDILREEIFVGRFETLLNTLGLSGNPEKISDDYFFALSEGHDVIEGAVEFLEWLKQNGFLIYATTNGVSLTQYKRLRDSGLEPYFDDVFVSESVGAQKPGKKYFDTVLSRVPVEKESVLLIGDSLSSDIMGGINAGIDTCWYNPNGKPATVKPDYTVDGFDGIRAILKPQNGKG